MIELIFQRLISDTGLTEKLTTYRDAPAVFYQNAPVDTDARWGTPQYPRIIFLVEMQDDPERNVSGQMAVEIQCTGRTCEPEEIESAVLDLLDNVFFTDDRQVTTAVTWRNTDAFDEPGDVMGMVVWFDIIEFPVQSTYTDPDPILSLQDWTKRFYPNILRLGQDLPEIYLPAEEQPAVYWRFERMANSGRDSWQVRWFDISIVGHIIAPDYATAVSIANQMIVRIQMNGRISLLDGSWMMIDRIQNQPGAHPLKEGQIKMIGRFGVLSVEQDAPPLRPIMDLKERSVTHE